MPFKPLTRMWDRIEVGRSDSDITFFNDLMYLGEMVVKLIVSGFVASIGDDPDRLRYKQLHRLVRTDGIGEWVDVLDEVLTGPPAMYIISSARDEHGELTQKKLAGSWQHDAVTTAHQSLLLLDPTAERLPDAVDARRWLRIFAQLRNKSRGHGAPRAETVGKICLPLEHSLKALTDNFTLFKREWAYLYRNLSGKYRVTELTETCAGFARLKTTSTETLQNGVYVLHEAHFCRVELMDSSVVADDFLFANGGFNGKKYELLSYITGSTVQLDASPYLAPVGPLPQSETEPLTLLEIQGQCLANLPPMLADYVRRPSVERELLDVLKKSDQHPILTLVGRGGTGKTSVALAALHAIKDENLFDLIIWFSSRDIDLLASGVKQVRPQVLNIKDVAREFTRLVVSPEQAKVKSFDPITFLATAMTKSPFGRALFVFDNFETLTAPVDFYRWIDNAVRLPSKVLVTSRSRDFKGDYPISVEGMTEAECERLIDAHALRLDIGGLLTTGYREELIRESDGHPYVIKILLGEVAKAKRATAIERIVADREDILVALFERTYAMLSPAAQRVFLTLCNWRATVPQLAVEAVLLRAENERMDVNAAVDELHRSSFIELTESEADGQTFISVPLVAAMFGKPKVMVSAMKSAIQADTELIRQFGAGQRTEIRHGVGPRVRRLMGVVAEEVASGKRKLEEHLPTLRFVAQRYPAAWLLLADLHEEAGSPDGLRDAKEAVRKFLEEASGGDALAAWKRLAELCRRSGDSSGEIHALVEMSEKAEIPFDEISSAANRFNSMLIFAKSSPYGSGRPFDSEEKAVLAQRLVSVMERRISEAQATDLSRLAWLCLHLKDEPRAKQHVERGLAIDRGNEHLNRLAERLSRGGDA